MSKRTRGATEETDVATIDSHKRVKDEAKEAISKLLEHSDELIEILQGLKTDSDKKKKLRKQLAELTHGLMPTLRSISASHKISGPDASEAISTPVTTNSEHNELPQVKLESPSPEPAAISNVQTTATQSTESLTAGSWNATEGLQPGEPVPKKGAEIPWYYLSTKWTLEDVPEELPALPFVQEDLKVASFTHSALIKNGTELSYERLEWLGDAYLYIISTAFIFQTFGSLPTGRCAQIRETLVKNATLAAYFREYNMGQFARVPRERERATRNVVSEKDTQTIKVQGDMFEAFVAAIVLSSPQHGVARASQWLKALWARNLKKELKSRETHPDISGGGVAELGENAGPDAKLNAKTRLAMHIQVPGVKIQYIDMECKKKDKGTGLPLYTVAVHLTGWGETNKMLAMGTALSKKEAGQKAAILALESTKLMKVYHKKKNEWVTQNPGGSARGYAAREA